MYLSVLCLQKSVDVCVVVGEEIFQRFIFEIKLCGNELSLCKYFTLSPLGSQTAHLRGNNLRSKLSLIQSGFSELNSAQPSRPEGSGVGLGGCSGPI